MELKLDVVRRLGLTCFIFDIIGVLGDETAFELFRCATLNPSDGGRTVGVGGANEMAGDGGGMTLIGVDGTETWFAIAGRFSGGALLPVLLLRRFSGFDR